MATVYVALRDEGVDVWRPVEAEQVTESIYRLADAPPLEGEVWEFGPGSAVRCERRELSEGWALVAVQTASAQGVLANTGAGDPLRPRTSRCPGCQGEDARLYAVACTTLAWPHARPA